MKNGKGMIKDKHTSLNDYLIKFYYWKGIGDIMQVLFIEGKRNGYDMEQCGETLTVEELIELLSQYDENMSIYLRNDNGYTYGSITSEDLYTNEDLE